MLFNLKNIFADEGEESISLSMDFSARDYGSDKNPFQGPVVARGSVFNKADTVELYLEVTYPYTAECDRCGEAIHEERSLVIDAVLAQEVNEDENEHLILVQEYQLDLEQLVWEFVLLDLPTKHLCREDCKGLCVQCGKNLNTGACGCKKEDPRLSVWKALLE